MFDALTFLPLEALPTHLGQSIKSPTSHIKTQGCITEQLLQNHADITCPKRLIKHLLLQFSPIPASLKASKFIMSAQRHFRSLWQRTERQGQDCKRGMLEAFFPV